MHCHYCKQKFEDSTRQCPFCRAAFSANCPEIRAGLIPGLFEEASPGFLHFWNTVCRPAESYQFDPLVDYLLGKLAEGEQDESKALAWALECLYCFGDNQVRHTIFGKILQRMASETLKRGSEISDTAARLGPEARVRLLRYKDNFNLVVFEGTCCYDELARQLGYPEKYRGELNLLEIGLEEVPVPSFGLTFGLSEWDPNPKREQLYWERLDESGEEPDWDELDSELPTKCVLVNNETSERLISGEIPLSWETERLWATRLHPDFRGFAFYEAGRLARSCFQKKGDSHFTERGERLEWEPDPSSLTSKQFFEESVSRLLSEGLDDEGFEFTCEYLTDLEMQVYARTEEALSNDADYYHEFEWNPKSQ